MSAGGQILVIDDEPALRHTLARILQHAGFQATTASAGAEGLLLLEQQNFDLVYLDIRLPDMSGMEVLKRIHAVRPDLPVVLFTGQPDLSSALEALRQGAADYLLKPLQPEKLVERANHLLARQARERRKRQIREQIAALQAELERLESADMAIEPAALSSENDDGRFLTRGKFCLDLHARRARFEGRELSLPPSAFDYLLVLVRHAPNVVDYPTLVTEAQGYQVAFREAQELVKWHIHQIRQALEPEERNSRHLINVRGIGYRLVVD
ncbi:MAG: response regulator transcription factor [Anaerolineales bacterium]|nr:response regulator transcription factor [Anaerolineales bacterium]MCX7756490.1 response regulator transcription factor [Anaerolineales bacterium]MDW8278363.1 response regulator transcription factor [Anaerolineales bacterium]